MYHHFIEEMASSLVEAGLTTDKKQVELVLTKYWADKIAVVWTTEDVHGIQKDFDKDKRTSSLSDEQALEILLTVFEEHDCNNGITWESLRYWSQEYLEGFYAAKNHSGSVNAQEIEAKMLDETDVPNFPALEAGDGVLEESDL